MTLSRPEPDDGEPGGPLAAPPTPAPDRKALREVKVMLGDAEVTIRPLRTRDALAVAKTLMGYVRELRDPFIAAMGVFTEGESQNASDAVEVMMKVLDIIHAKLEDDDLLKFTARILGQDVEVVGEAPLEDTLDAVVAAFELNDMPAIVNSAKRIATAAQGFVGGRNNGG